MIDSNGFNLQPNFTRISNKVLQLINWSPTTLRQKRIEKIDNASIDQHRRIEHNTLKIENIFKLDNISSFNQRQLTISVKSHILRLEKNNDNARLRKLQKLKIAASYSPEKIEIINFFNQH